MRQQAHRRRTSKTWPATTVDDAVGERRRPARSSWLATITVAPDGHGLAEQRVELVAAVGVEPGVGLVEQPQLGPAGDQAGERGAPLLAGREPRTGTSRSRPATPSRSIAAGDLVVGGADGRAPEADVLGAR